MGAIDLSDVIAGLALVVSGAALALALAANRIASRGLRTTAYQNATDLVLEADRLFVQWPELRPFFFEGKVASDADRYRVEAAADFHLDVLEAIWDHHDRYEPHDAEGWREWIHQMLQTAPAMRGMFEKDPEWYPALADMLRSGRCSEPEKHTWAGRRQVVNADIAVT